MFCLIDIDKFKHINDTYGHKTGDIVLVEMARCLKASFRESDIVMRLGGDEFAVFAKGLASPSVAEYCINELFKKLDALEIPDLQGEGVSISVGINLIPEGSGLIFDQIYQEADAVLYESKKTTGNSFTFHK